MALFPPDIAGRQDSKFYSQTKIDNTTKGEIEGGYAAIRPRTTRAPRKKWTTGFTDLTPTELASLDTFYDTVGTHTAFDWINPTTGVTFSVRFEKPFTAKYAGVGGVHFFDVADITLIQQ